MKTSSIVAIIVAIIVVAGAVWYFASSPNTTNVPLTTNTASTTGTTASTAASTTPTAQIVTVHYTASGFSPQTVTIHQGDTVNWVADSGQMWVASAPHPAHTGYDGTDLQTHCATGYTGPAPLDECAAGTTFSFTFDKVGTWAYHDHLNHNNSGTVIVE